MKKVEIIIVNWNRYHLTKRCLQSVFSLKAPAIKTNVLLVDNGSTDGSSERLVSEFPALSLLALDKNYGFTGGNNRGVEKALSLGADYIWFLNNDTIVDKTSLENLVSSGGDISGSKIYFAPGFEYHKERYAKNERGKVIWYAGGIIDWKNVYASHRGVDEVDSGQFDRPGETQFVTGCSMLVKRSVFERIGTFDDRYYLYLEDVDFCIRAKRNRFSVIYAPTSKVWHFNAGSSGGVGSPLHNYYLTRNRLLLGFQYAPLRTRLALLRQAINIVRHHTMEERQAVIDALTGRFGKRYEPKN